MKTLTLTAILALVIMLGAATSTQAKLIIYEPFNYAWGANNLDCDGGLNGGNGLPYDNTGGTPAGSGTGLRNTWGSSMYASNGLTYSTLICSNYGGFETVSGWGTANVYSYRDMTTNPYLSYRIDRNAWGAPGTTLWLSFLLRCSATNQNARLNISGINGQNTYIGFSGTDGKLSILRTHEVKANYGSVVGSPDTTLLVTRWDFGTVGSSSSNVVSLWVNPTLGVTPSGAPDSYVSASTNMNILYYSTRTSAANILEFDELRIGETYADVTPFVVPEPALLGVLALGGLLLRRRA